jgi:hypothetical protein
MIIYGYRTRNSVLGQVQYGCQKCQQNSFHTVVRSKVFMTLFWIPLFPISKKTTARCNTCGFQEKVDNKKADAMFAQQPAPVQQA